MNQFRKTLMKEIRSNFITVFKTNIKLNFCKDFQLKIIQSVPLLQEHAVTNSINYILTSLSTTVSMN